MKSSNRGRFLPKWSNAVIGQLCAIGLLLGLATDLARAQPYLYHAQGTQGEQFVKDLSFLLGEPVRVESGVVPKRFLSGKFQAQTREAFLNLLAQAGDFAWASNSSAVYLVPKEALESRTYRFFAKGDFADFQRRLHARKIEAGSLQVTRLESKQGSVYSIVALPAWHKSAGALYAELSGHYDQGSRASDSVLYQAEGDIYAIMLFRLRHAWAADTQIGTGEEKSVLPGIATLMRKVLAARHGNAAPQMAPKTKRSGLQGLLNDGIKKLAEVGIKKPQPKESEQGQDGAGSTEKTTKKGGEDKKKRALIFADPRQNAVVLYDERIRYDYYKKLITELDTRTRLVKIEAAIVDISKNKISDLGIEWQGGIEGYQGGFGSLQNTASQNISGLALATPGLSLATNAIVSNVNGLIARINILESRGEGRIVSRPSILTLDNIEASLSTSQKFFVRVEAFQDSSLYPVEVGTHLKVTPHIIDGKTPRIKLLVSITDGSIDQSASSSVDNLPRVTTNTISTQAEIFETQALVIGGHIRTQLETRIRQVPFLGAIPVLGWPFRHKTKTRREVIRLYILRPRITLPTEDPQIARHVDVEEIFSEPLPLLDKVRKKEIRRQEKEEAKLRRKRMKEMRKKQKQKQTL